MKKIAAVVLSVAFMLSVSTGCSPKKEEQTQSAGKADEAQKKPFWILFNQSKPGWPQNLEADVIRQEMQKRSGVQFTVEGYNGADYDTKLQLYIASGKYPDMWVAKDLSEVEALKKSGVIRPVGKLLDEYGKDIKKYFYDQALDVLKSEDGELWGLPTGFKKGVPGNEPQARAPVIRLDWIQKLNLKVPQTLDEYHDVIKAFTFNDPDGNGKKDTYGLAGTGKEGFSGFKHIFNAFGITPEDWFLRNGKLQYGMMTEEYKDAVKLLRSWYAEGIIDPEFPLMEEKDVNKKLINEKTGSTFGSVWMTSPRLETESALRAKNPSGDIALLDPLTGPTGKKGNPAPDYINNIYVFSNKAEQPELLMKLINWLAKDDNSTIPTLGLEGVHWDWNADKTERVRKKEWEAANKGFTVGIGNLNRILPIQDRSDQPKETRDDIIRANKDLLPNEFTGWVPAMGEYPDLTKDVIETTSKVILGVAPVEELDHMQQRWYKNGGQKITDQVNEKYKSRKK